MRSGLVACILLVACASVAAAQDVVAGRTVFRKCFPCHDVGEKAQFKLGPILNGLDGRKAGSLAGFKYTEATKSSGIVWDEASFKRYIRDPSNVIPGNRMAFIGLKDDKEIADVWAFLKQFTADGRKDAPPGEASASSKQPAATH